LAINLQQLGQVKIKTGHLRNNLSRYLKRVRQTGETIIVLDRKEAIAELRPISSKTSSAAKDVWARRAGFIREAGSWEEDFDLPVRQSHPHKQTNPLD
jgi:antitoxin (DNA-binding transcriptional repressor) of toxin-antitoxin stability system